MNINGAASLKINGAASFDVQIDGVAGVPLCFPRQVCTDVRQKDKVERSGGSGAVEASASIAQDCTVLPGVWKWRDDDGEPLASFVCQLHLLARDPALSLPFRILSFCPAHPPPPPPANSLTDRPAPARWWSVGAGTQNTI